MKAIVSLITLGVSDVERSKSFYCEGLGFTASKSSSPDAVFVQLGELVLSLFKIEELHKDAQLSPRAVPTLADPFGNFSLAQNLSTKVEVDEAMSTAAAAGAKILKAPEDTFWGGYAGYFADPDGHLWELAWNPFWPLQPNGHVLLPD